MKHQNMKCLLIMGASAIMALTTHAQEVSIDGEFRPRTEYRDGYASPLTTDSDPGISTIQRTRLGLTIKTHQLKTRITLQDARTWGESSTSSEANTASGATSVYEAWVEITPVAGLAIQLGRQPLKYDDNRLFSASAWSNTGNAHDLALFKYSCNQFVSHYGIAYNNDKAISTETAYGALMKYRFMQYLWLSQTLSNRVSLSAIAIDEGIQENITDVKKINMYHTYTMGGNVGFKKDNSPFSLLATAYFQAGKSATTRTNADASITRYDQDGFMTALKMNYNIMTNKTITLGIDYFSGDDNKDDTKTGTFRKLYGSDHNFNGYMDYWNTLDKWGLVDYYISTKIDAGKKLSFEAAYHLFNTAEEWQVDKSKELGSELDLTASYTMDELITLQCGWSTYFTNDNTKTIKNKSADADLRFPQWAYVMLTITPKYYKTVINK